MPRLQVRAALSTDQKVGGSSPSERAQVTGPYPLRGGVFFVPVGAMLGATETGAASARPMTVKLSSCAWKPSSGYLRCAGSPAVPQEEWWKSPTSLSLRTNGNWSTSG